MHKCDPILGFRISLGYLFKKTNSLWSATIVHTVYNLLIYTRSLKGGPVTWHS
ncbi:type II CAAX prenyl endopeptidase Rce1 family protein [Paenibacillus dendrobii]|uniref:CPBP family glutamic-type intramembrane protease n=1 Tax=Paenibacillus dendrobii TaxID=2691084 RepID=UPI003C6E0C39